MNNYSLIGKLGACIALAALVSGCATPANPQNMTLKAAEATDIRQNSPEWTRSALAVKEVTGGKETNPAWTSQVSSDGFKAALEESLKSVGMLADPLKAKYEVVAQLQKLDQPIFGASMTVTVTVSYQLVDRATRKTVAEKVLTTPYTAAWNAAFSGVERLRIANEGSVRESVTAFIKHLQSLKASDIAVR